MQVKDVDLRKGLEVLNLGNAVLAKHEHAEADEGRKTAYRLDLVVVQVEKNYVWKPDEVVDLADPVVLKVQQSKLFLAFENRDHREVPALEVQALGTHHPGSLRPVHKGYSREAWVHSKDDTIRSTILRCTGLSLNLGRVRYCRCLDRANCAGGGTGSPKTEGGR